MLIQQLRMASALVIAGMIFWHFGWWVAKPVDPAGPVSLLMVEEGVIAMAELLGLAVVVSGLAVAICGAGSAERGPLAVAVGLSTLAHRGVQMDKLVLHRLTTASGQGPPDPFPVWGFIAETWLWLALIGVGFVVGRWVEGWFESPRSILRDRRHVGDHATDIRQAVGTVVVAFCIAWVLVSSTVGGHAVPMHKGQIYFGLFLGFLVASLIAHWFFQAETRVWALLAIALAAGAGYFYGEPDGEIIQAARASGTYVTLKSVARPLPIEYAAVGGIGVLLEADVMWLFRVFFGLGPADRERTGRSSD